MMHEAACEAYKTAEKLTTEAKEACAAKVAKLEADLKLARAAQKDLAAEVRFYENEMCTEEDSLAEETAKREKDNDKENDEDVCVNVGDFQVRRVIVHTYM